MEVSHSQMTWSRQLSPSPSATHVRHLHARGQMDLSNLVQKHSSFLCNGVLDPCGILFTVPYLCTCRQKESQCKSSLSPLSTGVIVLAVAREPSPLNTSHWSMAIFGETISCIPIKWGIEANSRYFPHHNHRQETSPQCSPDAVSETSSSLSLPVHPF